MSEGWELVEPRPQTVDLSTMGVDELGALARAEHELAIEEADQALSHLTQGVVHGIRAGEALLKAKEIMGGSEWKEWLEPLGISVSRATNYCRWAYYQDRLLGTSSRVNANSANSVLAGLPPVVVVGHRQWVDSSMVKDCHRLKGAGMTDKEIAELLCVSVSTVRYHIDPNTKKARIAQSQKDKKRRRAERDALARQERDRLARQAKGDLSKAYSLVRQLCSVLDSALLDCDADRGEVRAALSFAHRSEDHISSAIRTTT